MKLFFSLDLLPPKKQAEEILNNLSPIEIYDLLMEICTDLHLCEDFNDLSALAKHEKSNLLKNLARLMASHASVQS